MTNGEEHAYGFNPTVKDALEDADGDRYPNIFELRKSTDPTSASSVPTADFTVNGAGGGTHTSVGAAVAAASTANGDYQIIGIAPGVYGGSANDLVLPTSKPKFLILGLEGAATTIFDGSSASETGYSAGWYVQNTAVIASLTFQKWKGTALFVDNPGLEARLVDLVVRDGTATGEAAGAVWLRGGTNFVIGSTLVNNAAESWMSQVFVDGGTATFLNSVIWSQGTTPSLVKMYSSTSLVTNHSLAKGQTLTGTGNLAGTVDPKFRPDFHLLWDSPLRAAGGAVAQSRIDTDGELRPSSAPDIGVDQFLDTDSDGLADQWEQTYAGNLTTLTGRTQDADTDGLSNDGEYANLSSPFVADTDGDGVSDGDEVLVHQSSPLRTDTDADDMPDGWEVTYGLAPTVRSTFEDKDGDGYPNVFEYARGSNPADIQSKPTPDFTVNGAGGGTHTSVGAAVAAATTANGAYQIIGIAPGVYGGSANDVILPTSKPKFLIIGLEGAAKTVIDGRACPRPATGRDGRCETRP